MYKINISKCNKRNICYKADWNINKRNLFNINIKFM